MARKINFFIAVSLLLSSSSYAVETKSSIYSLPNTNIRLLTAKTNGIAYKIYLSFPSSYQTNTAQKYPAIFLLDADYSFALARQITDHLSDRKKLPETLLIGVAYDGPPNYKIHRTRDYTPTFVADGGYGAVFQQYSGGGANFLNFLKNELIPYIKNNFRISSTALVGHSFGGLFTSLVFLNDSEAFDNYIAVSPSLWYDKHYIFRNYSKFKFSNKNSKRIFLCIGDKENNGENRMVDDTVEMQKIFNKSKINSNLEIISGEDHNTVFPSGFTRGVLNLLAQNKVE